MLALIALLFQTLTTASVGGRVVDSSGVPIPGATVTITDTERNHTESVTAGADGRYRFRPLPPGSYTLTATLEGMKAPVRQLGLTVGQVLDIPISMAPAYSESLSVVNAEVIETRRTQVAATVTPEEVRQLPLNGRNYLDLALLAPGVSRTNTGANQRFAETSAVPGTGISVSTQRNLNNSFLVDGLSSNDDAAELAGTFYSQEVIREFQVIRSAGVAEFGRASGGVINVVTQSGTNAFRGDAYGFFRSQRLDADNPLTGSRLPLSQQQYGTSLGGPLVRDRTWFFTNFEQLRQRAGGVITIAPSAVAAINARLDAVGYRGARLTTGAFDTALHATNTFVRVDQNLHSALDLVTLRFNSYDADSTNARNAGGLNALSRATGLANHDRTLALNNMAIFSDDLLGETRAQITRSRLNAPTNDAVGPAVNIAGIASFGVATFSPTARDIDLYELAQNVSWYRGAHSLKGGVDLLRNDVTITFPGALQGVYTFRDLPSFLAGSYASFQQAFGDTGTEQRNDNFAAFVQDEWRTTPRLTINAGLRYDVQRLPSLVHTDRNNFSPRFAAAWDVRGDGRSVLRLGAGIYYDRIPLRAVSNALQRNGVTYRVAQVGPGTLTFPNVFAAFPAGLVTNVTTIDPHIRNSRSEQAMLQYERQVGRRGTVAVGYEHLRGRDLIMSRNVNAPAPAGRPDPTIGNNGQFQSIGDSWYDGLTLSASWRPELRLSYTFSKGLDTSGNFFFSTPQDNSDIAAERGRSDNDQRHRLTLSGTIDAPLGLQLSYLYAYTSALPFNIQLPNDRNGDTNFNDRPPGVGRNTGRGFDYQSLDLRISRRFGHIEAIVDAFNVLNRANYQVSNNIITSPTFGQPTAVNDPRQLQLGVRVRY